MAINSNGDEYTPGKCFECRAGEHEDEDDDIKQCVVTGDGTKKGYLCNHHRAILEEDGYTVKTV